MYRPADGDDCQPQDSDHIRHAYISMTTSDVPAPDQGRNPQVPDSKYIIYLCSLPITPFVMQSYLLKGDHFICKLYGWNGQWLISQHDNVVSNQHAKYILFPVWISCQIFSEILCITTNPDKIPTTNGNKND